MSKKSSTFALAFEMKASSRPTLRGVFLAPKRSTLYNKRSTLYNKRSTLYNKRSTLYNIYANVKTTMDTMSDHPRG